MSRLVAIVGPTASGKSKLAMAVAKQFDGEIICADSRTIYRGMDIGTAKPSADDRVAVPHHLLDLIDPDQTYSAAEFKAEAEQTIQEIKQHHHLPILCGGSGLYVYSVIYDYHFPAGADNDVRQELQSMPLDELVSKLRTLDPEAAETIDLKNPRRVIRAIETAGQPRQKNSLRPDTILVGLTPSNEDLSKLIKSRTDHMLKGGLEKEVRELVSKYPHDLEVFRSPGYADVIDLLEDRIQDFELPDLVDLHTLQLAKRQMTWFKRNPDIEWFSDSDAAFDYVSKRLSEAQV